MTRTNKHVFFLCLGENNVIGLDQSNFMVPDCNCLTVWGIHPHQFKWL